MAALVMLVVQYGLGIFLNLYVPVPAADAHAGMIQEIRTAPFALTVHALLGLALIGTAIVLVVRAARLRDRTVTVLAAAGLGAIGGAFVAGEAFVKDGQSGTSFAMAGLTGAALLCYVCVLAALPVRRRALPAAAPVPVSAGPGNGRYQEAARPMPLPRRPASGPPLTAYRAAVWTPPPEEDFPNGRW